MRFLYLLFCTLFFGCLSINSERPKTKSILQQFPNVLNYEGIPDSIDDRSIFAFSDKGAWHGYALPTTEDKSSLGSFIGPFLMTQDNGIWLGKSMAQFQIFNQETKVNINLSHAKVEEIASYPHLLRQKLILEDVGIILIVELRFITNRTAAITATIKNISSSKTPFFQMKWTGQHFGIQHFSMLAKAMDQIEISFKNLYASGVNEHKGIIQAAYPAMDIIKTRADSYQMNYPSARILAGEEKQFTVFQTFCFSEEEWAKEQVLLEDIKKDIQAHYKKTDEEWEQRITRVTNNLRPDFQEKKHQHIAVKCVQTMRDNWRSAAGFLQHDGLFPSYNYKWFHGFWSWDSWKHSVALAKYFPELAKEQIWAMYHFQDEYGMIADCVYRDTVIEQHNWRDTKPPLSGWAIWEVYERTQNRIFLEKIYPQLQKYHQWWYDYRDHDQNGWCEYGSTDGTLIAAKWESGMDNAVRFDETKLVENKEGAWSMNRESVDLNAYLCAEKLYLSKIATTLNLDKQAGQYKKQYEELKEAIQTHFYAAETNWFHDLDLETKEPLTAYGAEGWIPLWAELATKEQAAQMKTTLLDTTKFATYIPFPTLAADHPRFKPQNGYWRGPVWLDQAYFGITALRNYGYEKEASQFSEQLFERLEGIQTNGALRENYHPHTGEGLESHHFSWSAASLLNLLME